MKSKRHNAAEATAGKARPGLDLEQLKAPARLRPQTILVPVDFSSQTIKAVQYARAFAQEFGAKLTLVHVIEPAVIPDNFGVVPPAYEEWTGALIQTAQQRLGQLAVEVAENKLSVRPIVCTGRPAWEIVRVARETAADLIIVSTHGYSGLKHVLLGSTAELVVRHAPCPVLTVREVEHDFVQPDSG